MTHQEAERRQKGGVEVTRRADPVYAQGDGQKEREKGIEILS